MRLAWVSLFLVVPLFLFALAVRPAPATSAPTGAPQYRLELLGDLPGHQNTVPWGINDHGDVVGWSGWPSQPFLYTDSTGMTPIALPAGYSECVARDINDHGEIAGTCGTQSSSPPMHAFRWSAAGTPQDLGTLGGTTSEGWAINNAGNVTGSASDGSFLGHHAFLYTDQQGMVDLLPGSAYSPGYDINEVGSGQVTGYRNSNTAFRWTSGTLELLGVPAGYSYSYGFAINDLGHVAGSAKIAGANIERVFRYTDEAGWEELGGTGSTNLVWDMNNAGHIIGNGRPSGGIERAFIYTDEIGMQDLGDYIVEPPATWGMLSAHGINNAGQIVGLAIHSQSGEIVAARLTPLSAVQQQRLWLPLVQDD